MAYIRKADRPKELPEKLKQIRESLNDPEYMNNAINHIADNMAKEMTRSEKEKANDTVKQRKKRKGTAHETS